MKNIQSKLQRHRKHALLVSARKIAEENERRFDNFCDTRYPIERAYDEDTATIVAGLKSGRITQILL